MCGPFDNPVLSFAGNVVSRTMAAYRLGIPDDRVMSISSFLGSTFNLFHFQADPGAQLASLVALF